jgi:hypothetical protein
MAAQPTTDTRARWAAFIDTQLDQRDLGGSELSRLIDRSPTVDPSVITRWRQAKLLPTAEIAVRVAAVLDLPATLVLREGGHPDTADYIERVTARDGTGPDYLEPLIARVRALTDGLTDEQRRRLEEDLLRDASNWFTLAEVKAQRLRDKDTNPDTPTGKRTAS